MRLLLWLSCVWCAGGVHTRFNAWHRRKHWPACGNGAVCRHGPLWLVHYLKLPAATHVAWCRYQTALLVHPSCAEAHNNLGEVGRGGWGAGGRAG